MLRQHSHLTESNTQVLSTESQAQVLKSIADRICRDLGILCFSDLSGEELEKMLMFAFT
jgi:predicted ATPase